MAETTQLFKLNQQTVRTGSTAGNFLVFAWAVGCESVGRTWKAFMEPAGPATPGVRPARASTQAQAFWDAG